MRRMAEEMWTTVMSEADLPEGRSVKVLLEGKPVMLYRSGERLFAIGDRCTHQGAPLDRGPVKIGGSEATVTCLAHGSMFRLRDGSVARGPAMAPVAVYDVRIADGSVELRPRP
jgi:nitrite reductase/ring-hydroxylating ferredoxin subunit